jgi:hypothetical protein
MNLNQAMNQPRRVGMARGPHAAGNRFNFPREIIFRVDDI